MHCCKTGIDMNDDKSKGCIERYLPAAFGNLWASTLVAGESPFEVMVGGHSDAIGSLDECGKSHQQSQISASSFTLRHQEHVFFRTGRAY